MRQLGPISPSAADFAVRAQSTNVIPVTVTVMADTLTPVGLYQLLARDRPGTFLMESAAPGGVWSRYSFVGVNSRATLTTDPLGDDPQAAYWQGEVPAGVPTDGTIADVLKQTLAVLATEDQERADLPTLLAGLVGYIGWDMIQFWEQLPARPDNDLQLPLAAMNLVTDLAIFDNTNATVTLVANAINFNGLQTGVQDAYADALARLEKMLTTLQQPAGAHLGVTTGTRADEDPAARIAQRLASEIRADWDAEEYGTFVTESKATIEAGEITQIVLSRRFETELDASALDVYRMLRFFNPSPYMFLYNFQTPKGQDFQLVGSSPEALVTVQHGQAISHPIAGTRRRGATEAEDQQLEEELLADDKERSEHIMLVDLAKEDLAKVCDPATIQVPRYMFVERFSHVMHLISHVTGTIRQDLSAYDVLAATFPAGTLSGAPKPRAIELIEQWEPYARGPYGGVVGYFDFAGNMDMAIVIRSAILKDGKAYVQTGAGIVAQSVPAAEADETTNKAAAPLRGVLLAKDLQDVDAGYLNELNQLKDS
ncbi:chorismate-binding protein [Micrococcoides hystricis]|uniref:Anthranilate synthase component 1 n=1 Tax=Micrococcoides hystricis TaxID=1572761 RepID=A0ABV6P706_9MICC